MRPFLFLTAILATTPALPLSAQASILPAAAPADHFSIASDGTSLPIFITNGFIFIPGQVGGIAGKFMFDTGTREALALNDHLLPNLGPGKPLGEASVGSGQRYLRTSRSWVRDVRLSGWTSGKDLPNVESEDLGFIEKDITPDFLGFIGFEAWANFSFKLDYLRRRLTFYKAEASHDAPAYLQNETVLARLPFSTRKRPDDPFVPVRIGSEQFISGFDTGQVGTLEMTDSVRNELLRQGALTALHEKGEDDETLYRINRLQFGNGYSVSLPGLPIQPPHSISDRGVGVTESNVIYLGSQFLSQFKTVWDFSGHTIYLLEK